MAKIVFPELIDSDIGILPSKGVLDAVIESQGKKYDMSFYGLIRLPYEIKLRGGIIEAGVMIFEELTIQAIENGIERAEKEGVFKRLVETPNWPRYEFSAMDSTNLE